MIIFVDSDVILDLLWHRSDWKATERLFVLAENNQVDLVTSVNIVANVYYLLAKKANCSKAKKLIGELRKIFSIISISELDVDWALESKMADFEDALQYSAAIRSKVNAFVTRNIKDYPKGKLSVVKPLEMISLLTN